MRTWGSFTLGKLWPAPADIRNVLLVKPTFTLKCDSFWVKSFQPSLLMLLDRSDLIQQSTFSRHLSCDTKCVFVSTTKTNLKTILLLSIGPIFLLLCQYLVNWYFCGDFSNLMQLWNYWEMVWCAPLVVLTLMGGKWADVSWVAASVIFWLTVLSHIYHSYDVNRKLNCLAGVWEEQPLTVLLVKRSFFFSFFLLLSIVFI